MNKMETLGSLTRKAFFDAIREYFRPIGTLLRIPPYRTRDWAFHAPTKVANCDVHAIVLPSNARPDAERDTTTAVEAVQQHIRFSLRATRNHEKLLLALCIACGLAGFSIAILLLMVQLKMEPEFILLLSIGLCFIFGSIVSRILGSREKIVQLKTLYRLMESIDHETAERMVKQVTWENPRMRRAPKRSRRTPQ
ncbi:MAG TPA: hypothetical protein VGP68_14000 [Gemmataceae bacterium]|jgi:hypothetical protein|nr:hypothetical protein [Gemmataceae bacterium]